MITIEQIKAGRALLDWNQEDLARQAELSKAAINKLERRIVLPRSATLQKIQQTMENAGVEFTEGPGVRLRGEILQVRLLEGKDAIFRLFEDITQVLRPGDVMLWNGINERDFLEAGEEQFVHYLEKWIRMKIGSKLLTRHGDTLFVDAREHYRWVPPEQWSPIPHAVYGDRYAIVLWKPVQRILLITNKPIADSYRAQFNALWNKAAVPPAYVKSSYQPDKPPEDT